MLSGVTVSSGFGGGAYELSSTCEAGWEIGMNEVLSPLGEWVQERCSASMCSGDG